MNVDKNFRRSVTPDSCGNMTFPFSMAFAFLSWTLEAASEGVRSTVIGLCYESKSMKTTAENTIRIQDTKILRRYEFKPLQAWTNGYNTLSQSVSHQ